MDPIALMLKKQFYKAPKLIDLINKSTLTNNAYVDASGVLQTGFAAWKCTDYIPVTPGKIYTLYAPSSTGLTSYGLEAACYNSSKQFVSMVANQQMPYSFTAPAGVHYVIVNMGSSYVQNAFLKTYIYEDTLKSRWYGKIANFLGDSITNGAGLTTPTTERFSALVKDALGLATANNYGINGTRLANNVTASGADDANAMCRRYTAMADGADIVFLLAGTNDYGSVSPSLKTAPFGTFADRTDNTFYGACHVLFKGLLEKYPGGTIVVVTPLHRSGAGDSSSDDRRLNADTNKMLQDYVNAEREVAEYYGIPVLDLYKTFQINPVIPAHKTAYMSDGLHPNVAGHQLVAEAIVRFAKSIV